MTGYFKKNKLSHLDVNGNGQSIYFLNENNKQIDMNYIETSNISIKFQDNKIDQINYEIIPLSITTPYNDIKLKDIHLPASELVFRENTSNVGIRRIVY